MFGLRDAIKQLASRSEELTRLSSSTTVKIYVGDQDEPFELPKDLLSRYSPYFSACFNRGFKEGIEGVLHLPDEKPEAFEILVEYIYSRPTMGNVWDMLDKDDAPHPMYPFEGYVDKCFEFIRFCDSYDIVEASSAVAFQLKTSMKDLKPDDLKENLDFCFEKLHTQNPALLAIASWLDETRRKKKPLSVRQRDYDLRDEAINYVAQCEWTDKEFKVYLETAYLGYGEFLDKQVKA